jgi:hypothetical protein
MNPDVLMLTKSQISQAFEQRNTLLLKEEMFLVLNYP